MITQEKISIHFDNLAKNVGDLELGYDIALQIQRTLSMTNSRMSKIKIK